MTREVTETLQKICDIIRQSVPTERIYLFGSYAYGTPTQESDFDLFVVLPDAALGLHDAIVKIRSNLYDAGYRTPTDVLVNYKSSFDVRGKTRAFEQTILNKGVLLYGRGT